MRFRKSKRLDESREATLAVVKAREELQKVKEREPEVQAVSQASRDFRRKNHFAEALQLLFEGGR